MFPPEPSGLPSIGQEFTRDDVRGSGTSSRSSEGWWVNHSGEGRRFRPGSVRKAVKEQDRHKTAATERGKTSVVALRSAVPLR